MKFVCDRCQTKYSIADDKVRGKVLKVRCKTCQNVITVREPGVRPSQGSLQPVRPNRPSTGPLGILGDADEPVERTVLAAAPAGLMADLAQARRPTPPPPPPVGDGIEWFVAIEGAQQGPFTRKVLVDKLLALAKDADVHVWNDGMDGWKPPKDVPELAKDIAARRPPALPGRPRTTPSPPLPPTAAGVRRGTQPLASGVGVKLPHPTGAAAAHAVPAPMHAHEDAAAAMPTPAPSPAHAPAPAGRKTNGVSAHSSSPSVPLSGGGSDALSALNLGAQAGAPVARPRLMEVADATSWAGQPEPSNKKRGTTMVVALMGVVAAIIVVGVVSLGKKPAVVNAGPAPATKGGLDSEALARSAEAVAREPQKPVVAERPEPRPETGPGRKVVHGATRGARPATARGGTSPGAFTSGGAPGTTVAAAEENPNSRFMETGGRKVTAGASVSRRPPPSQGDIARVINNNKIGIKTCYQRALLRDSSLAHGKIVVGVTIGISGRVKSTRVDGPVSFRALEPCIKEMLGRWVFPQADEEYGTEFSYVFQGSE